MEEQISHKQLIYNFISKEISNGHLEYSGRLTEQYITDHLGISRTPVREALFQLAAEGVLEHTPRKGFKIKKLTKKDVIEIYEIIGVLDGKAAALALPLLTEQDFLEMQFLIDTMDSAIKNILYTKYNELQMNFHSYYINRCGNHSLITAVDVYRRAFLGTAYKNMAPEIIQDVLYETNREHQRILDLFKLGDVEELRKYIEAIHWNGEQAILDIW